MIFTYIITQKIKENIRGIFLSVNEKGIPVDFKYTEAVEVEKYQKYIFGDTLDKYLKLNVLLDKYFKTIDFNIDYILVRDEDFLEYEDFDNVVWISGTDEEPLESAGEYREIPGDNFLVQHSFSGNPTKVRLKNTDLIKSFAEKFSQDKPHAISHHFDILEPFKRLDKVIEVI
ncbi:MAG: hypothetical protein C0601_03960 [Candidatus Muiribacterium halophilum]|mgnify:CR=1 FL=1|uniref:Uncharacterized protein n=1 Tax=Muiribacterium halophilum TaxID=2053465 RepID=A0A2N5ZJ66_MUIH1|nr:MAG: hypothetical protein C0601_03960 [Candidatus Muirbacterium halophilum]